MGVTGAWPRAYQPRADLTAPIVRLRKSERYLIGMLCGGNRGILLSVVFIESQHTNTVIHFYNSFHHQSHPHFASPSSPFLPLSSILHNLRPTQTSAKERQYTRSRISPLNPNTPKALTPSAIHVCCSSHKKRPIREYQTSRCYFLLLLPLFPYFLSRFSTMRRMLTHRNPFCLFRGFCFCCSSS